MKKIHNFLKENRFTEALDMINLMLVDHSDLNDIILLAANGPALYLPLESGGSNLPN